VRIEPFEKAGQSRLEQAAALFAVVLAGLAVAATPAGASQTHVLLEEQFGSAEKQSFGYAKGDAVDQSTGDVLVVDDETNQIFRFHEDGTPSNFSALGTNAIDGKGTGDETPQNGLNFKAESTLIQIAVDNSGTATDGNIYVTQNGQAGGAVQAVDIFASSGEYVGQLTGAGATSFSSGGANASPCGVAVDPKGNLYVADRESDAIYKFDPTANPPVNTDYIGTPVSTPGPCSLAAGAGPSAGSLFVVEQGGKNVSKLNDASGTTVYVVHRTTHNAEPQHVSVNSADGHVFVTTSSGEQNTPAEVAEYDASQSPGPVLVARFANGPEEGSNGVAVHGIGKEGRVYLVRAPVIKVYSGLVPIPDAETVTASGIGKTNATLNGAVEAFGEELTECFFEYGLTSAYGSTVPCAESFAQIGTGSAKVHADIEGLDNETAYHYRLIAGNANGRGKAGKDVEFKTESKPELLGEWVEGVSSHEATLKAKINPQSGATEYRFEWGLTKAPYEHSSALISIGKEPVPQTVSLFLQGLKANTPYHFRVFAVNEMGPSTGADHTFTTFGPIPPPPTGDCPGNEEFRTAAGAFLPDCRAYEMVSPVDKNGGDIIRGELSNTQDPGSYVQSTADGNKITYTAFFASFAGEPASFKFNQYLAGRQERGEVGEGWSNEGIHPPVRGHKVDTTVFGNYREFIAFSPDLCNGWLVDFQTPALTPDGQKDLRNLYRRENCAPHAGELEALTSTPPVLSPGKTGENYVDSFSVQGASADSRHVLFSAGAKLDDDAHTGAEAQVYDRFGGENHLVSVLPGGGGADPANAVVGSGASGNLHNAVSTDGSLVYWTSEGVPGAGTIYVRRHPEQGIVANENCSTSSVACTLKVSADKTTPGVGDAFFRVAAADGSKALYSEGEDLYEFDLQGGESSLIAHHVFGVSGASEDLSHIYFVSTDALNDEDEGEAEGKPNLYLDVGGKFSFIATLVAGDLGAIEPGAFIGAYNLTGKEGANRLATRVSPDGTHLAFESRAPLIPTYDNTDSASGRPAVEVYRYAAGGALVCVSCNPSGGRPGEAGELSLPFEKVDISQPTEVFAAAWIPTWEHPLHASNVLSADGSRLFFNSFDALLPRDTNGVQDVYEWEAPGSGSCHTGDADYFAQNGGCLYLISSGESPSESEFWEASPDGKDVFFNTASSLLPQDPGSVDLYDARIDGGFPQPVVKAECEGEACQSPPPPPAFPTPASGSYNGPGNPKPGCPKGKHKVKKKGGKSHCAKKHKAKKHKKGKAKQKRRAHGERRAAR